MSDPVANVDIDDILASIRRLVMEDADEGVADPPPRSGPPPSRLVLTPALRVISGGEGGAATAPAVQMPRLLLDDPLPPAAPRQDLRQDPLRQDPRGFSPDPPPGAEAGSRGLAARLAAEIRPLDAPEAAAETRAATEPVFRSRTAREAEAAAAGDEAAAVGASVASFDEPGLDEFALDEFAPDEPSLDEPGLDEIDPPGAAAAVLPLDEAALRALLREVLREELAGELGERITRNLRKLVRREIFRILDTREAEGGP